MRALVIASLVVIGCGKVDPCANHSGICFGLRVEGSVKNLDQLAVTVDKPQPKTLATPVQPISLPVALALDLPAGVSGSVRISVVGLAHGVEVAAGSTTSALSGNRGSATVTLLSVSGGGVLDLSMPPTGDMVGGGGGDMTGIGNGSTDMAGCGLVTACVNSDNCCPSGCNGATDNDCPSVCGNSVVEPGEVCDDGNTSGGDGCDPTCRWREALTSVSGIAGSFGHADATAGVTRWMTPYSMAYDGTNLYVADEGDCTVRKLSGNLGNPSSQTIAGSAWDCSDALGTLATARFNMPGYNPDLEFLGGSLYMSLGSGVVRKIDIAGNMVTNAITGYAPQGLGHFGSLLVFYDSTASTGGLKTYNPANGNVATVSSIGTMTAAGVSDPNGTCHHAFCDATYCYLACNTNVVQVTMSSGAAANYAGVYNAGNNKWSNTCQTTASSTHNSVTFVSAWFITGDGAGTLYVTDLSCNSIIKLVPTGSTSGLYAGSGSVTGTGFVDGVMGSQARFTNPAGIVYVDNTDIFVADSMNGVIRNGTAAFVYTTSGAHHNVTEALGANGTTTNFGTGIVGVASDGTYAYLLDPTGRILKVTLASGAAAVLTLATPWPDTNGFVGLLYFNGALYTTNGDGVIQTVKTDGSGAAVYAGTPGTTTPPSDGPRLTAVMSPRGLATDGTNLYFIDAAKQIRSIDGAGMVHSLAGMAGTTDFMDGTGTGAHLLRAQNLASDGKNIYFADASVAAGQGGPGPSAIRRMNISTLKVDTIAGVANMTGHLDGAAATALFSGIGSLASDGLSLFAVDTETYNQQKLQIAPAIRQLDLKTMTVSTMIGTPGQQTFSPGSGTSALVHDPSFLTFDSTVHAIFLFDNAEYVLGRIK